MTLIPNTARITIALVALWLCQSASGQSPSSRVQLSSGYAPDGVLEPWKISDVACVEAGLLEKIHVTLGTRVTAGEPLATIESSALRMQLAIAEAEAESLGRQSAARADMELNQRRVAALSDAREHRYSSQSELERAEADLKISQGRLQSEVEEQEILRLQVARFKNQINQRTVFAPINGVVVKFHKELGEYVSPTSPEVVRVVDVSRLRASFFLQVDEVYGLPSDGKVRVSLDGGQESAAQVEHVSPVADGESGLIEVRVLIDNPEMKILGSRCSLLFDSQPAAGEFTSHSPKS